MIKILRREDKVFITDEDVLMKLAGLDTRMGYEDVGLQGDGTPVVFDKCGNFGYLDPEIYYAVFIAKQTQG